MKLAPNEVYHVYNRGINRQPIFFEKENYTYFLSKVKKYLAPNCDILAYTLMPNHFHFLISGNERSNIPFKKSNRFGHSEQKNNSPVKLTLFSWGLQQLLSTYSRGINQKFHRTGSLFQQNTKSKRTSSESLNEDYSVWCFIYIHNNAKSAGLVAASEDYEFTSYNEYQNRKEDSICNIDLAIKLLSLEENELIKSKVTEVPPDVLVRIFK